jgi:hypothetical protein
MKQKTGEIKGKIFDKNRKKIIIASGVNMKKIILITILVMFMICVLPSLSSGADSYRYVKVEGRKLLVDFDQNGVYEPYLIKGVGYAPYPIGRHVSDWGYEDPNDPRPDNIYDDSDILNRDFELLQEMNVNTIRIWKGNNTQDGFDVLKQLKSDEKPIITVLNKIDKLADKSWLERLKRDFPNSVAISALNKENIDGLLNKIQDELSALVTILKLKIPLNRMDLVDLIYREGNVLSIEYEFDAVFLQASIPKVTAEKLSRFRLP